MAEICVYALGLLVLVFALFNKGKADLSELFPICDGGVHSLTAGWNVGVWFGDFLPLIFIDLREDSSSSIKVYIASVIPTVLEVALCVLFLAEYSIVAEHTDSVLSRLMNQVVLSTEVGRLDYVGIIVWLMASVLYIGYLLAISKKAIQDVSNYKVAMITISILSVAVILLNEYVWTAVHQAYATALALGWVSIVMHYALPIILMIVAISRRNYGNYQQTKRE